MFISYSKEEHIITAQLAAKLENKGISVWWDTGLVAGDDFTRIIQQKIAEAKAAVVIWTSASVDSIWVRAEAQIAHGNNKLIPVKVAELSVDQIPPPYNALHTGDVDDIDRICSALKRLDVIPSL